MEGTVHLFILVGGTLLLAFFAKRDVSDRFQFPAVTLYVGLGIVLGISVAGLYTEELLQKVSFLSDIGIGFIAFVIGVELDRRTLSKLGKAIFFIALSEGLLAFVLVTGATYFLVPDRPYIAIVLGAVSAATAPAATVFVIRQFKARGPLSSTIMGIVGIDDAMALIIFVFASLTAESMILGSDISIVMAILRPIGTVAASIGIGAAGGTAAYFLLRRVRNPENLMMAIVSFVLLLLGITEWLGLSDLLGIMSFSVFLANTDLMLSHRLRTQIDSITPLLLPLFFIFAGAHLNIALIPQVGLLGIVYTVARIAGKNAGVALGGFLGKAPPVARKYAGLSLIPQVGVALALALTVQSRFTAPRFGVAGAELAEIVINVLLVTTIFTEVVGPLLTRATLRAAGETQERGESR